MSKQLNLFDESPASEDADPWCRIRRLVREREQFCRNSLCRRKLNFKLMPGIVRDVHQIRGENGKGVPVSEMFAYCNNDCRNEAKNG